MSAVQSGIAASSTAVAQEIASALPHGPVAWSHPDQILGTIRLTDRNGVSVTHDLAPAGVVDAYAGHGLLDEEAQRGASSRAWSHDGAPLYALMVDETSGELYSAPVHDAVSHDRVAIDNPSAIRQPYESIVFENNHRDLVALVGRNLWIPEIHGRTEPLDAIRSAMAQSEEIVPVADRGLTLAPRADRRPAPRPSALKVATGAPTSKTDLLLMHGVLKDIYANGVDSGHGISRLDITYHPWSIVPQLEKSVMLAGDKAQVAAEVRARSVIDGETYVVVPSGDGRWVASPLMREREALKYDVPTVGKRLLWGNGTHSDAFVVRYDAMIDRGAKRQFRTQQFHSPRELRESVANQTRLVEKAEAVRLAAVTAKVDARKALDDIPDGLRHRGERKAAERALVLAEGAAEEAERDRGAAGDALAFAMQRVDEDWFPEAESWVAPKWSPVQGAFVSHVEPVHIESEDVTIDTLLGLKDASGPRALIEDFEGGLYAADLDTTSDKIVADRLGPSAHGRLIATGVDGIVRRYDSGGSSELFTVG